MSILISPLKTYCRCIDSCSLYLGKLAAFLMPVLAFIVCFEVFSRYVLGKPTSWAHELSLFLFGYIAILGGAYAHLKKEHINVDVVYVHLSKKVKSICDLVAYVVGIFFLLIVVYKGVERLTEALEFDYTTQEWGAPMHHFWVMVIVGSSVYILQLLRDIFVASYFLFSGKNLLEKEKSEIDELKSGIS